MPKQNSPKQYTAEQFFRKPFALAAWRKGRSLFEETVNQEIPVADGNYEAMLSGAQFISSIPGRAIIKFIFVLPSNQIVTKNMAVESSEGVALICWEMARMGIVISSPEDLDKAFIALQKAQFFVEIGVSSMGGIRHVTINRVKGSGKPVEAPFFAKASEPEPKPIESVAEGESGPLPVAEASPQETAPIPEPVVVPEAAQQEVDIRPGHRIVIKVDGKRVQAEVIRTFEEENEIAVKLADGAKIIIPAEDVAEFIG